MNRAIRTASILHNESDYPSHAGERVKLNLVRDGNRYRWYTESGEDTEVSALTVAEACRAAIGSWGRSHVWGFRASWA